MKAADAAGLMAAGAGHVVEPALEACGRTDVLQGQACVRGLLQRRDDVALLEYSLCVIALHQAEGRLQVGGRKSDRGRSDRAGGEKSVRDQNRAAVQLAEMPGIEQPCLEVAFEIFIRQKPLAIDLILERRLLEHLRLRVVVKHLHQIIGAEISDGRLRRMRDLKIGFDAVDIFRPDQIQRTVL